MHWFANYHNLVLLVRNCSDEVEAAGSLDALADEEVYFDRLIRQMEEVELRRDCSGKAAVVLREESLAAGCQVQD